MSKFTRRGIEKHRQALKEDTTVVYVYMVWNGKKHSKACRNIWNLRLNPLTDFPSFSSKTPDGSETLQGLGNLIFE